MKSVLFIPMAGFILSIFSFTVSSESVWGESVAIDEVWMWQDEQSVVFKVSNGKCCYIPAGNKNMYSLMLSLFATGNFAKVYCDGSKEIFSGTEVNKVIKIISDKSSN